MLVSVYCKLNLFNPDALIIFVHNYMNVNTFCRHQENKQLFPPRPVSQQDGYIEVLV